MRNKVLRQPELDLQPLSASAKRFAWASLICWQVAVTAGRLLACLGPVSGLGDIKLVIIERRTQVSLARCEIRCAV